MDHVGPTSTDGNEGNRAISSDLSRIHLLLLFSFSLCLNKQGLRITTCWKVYLGSDLAKSLGRSFHTDGSRLAPKIDIPTSHVSLLVPLVDDTRYE